MAGNKEHLVKTTFKEVGSKTLWIFQNYKENRTRSIPTGTTRKMDNTQHI